VFVSSECKCQKLIWWHVDATHSLDGCWLLLLVFVRTAKSRESWLLVEGLDQRECREGLLLCSGLVLSLDLINSERGALKGKEGCFEELTV